MKPLLLAFCAMLSVVAVSAQAQKEKEKIVKKLPSVRTSEKIVIDGDLKDLAWQKATVATDFVEWRPAYGVIEHASNRTEIRILYDNMAIYVSGFCHMPNDSISSELIGRDKVGSNDYVGVLFDTYHDKINGF